MKFYIGSGLKNYKLVNYYAKILKENGLEEAYNWVKNIKNDITKKDLEKYAKEETQAIVNSDIIIILLPAGRGTHVELGMALALNKKIFLCSETNEEFNIKNTVAFYELPNIIKLVGTPDENIKKIINYK